MAWAAKHADGMILSVGFDRNTAPVDETINIVDIPDCTAVDVMEGLIRLQDCLGIPIAQPAAPQLWVAQPSHLQLTTRYPAMMSESDVDALIAISKLLSVGAVAVEIGSKLGGSAKIILDHAPRLKRIYCVDVEWSIPDSPVASDPAVAKILSDWSKPKCQTCLEFATWFLNTYPNARLLKLDSPYQIAWWSEDIDLLFENSSHANPQLRDSLQFWLTRIRHGGIIAGHAYGNSTYPDVKLEVDALAQQLGLVVHVQGTVWWMIKH
jgi:Methyltransferase domain